MFTIVKHPQGSQEWHTHRATHFNASEISAVLGISSYKTRSQLLHEKATGIVPDIDSATQTRFDLGHKYEEMARPWAEEMIGEDLYPAVYAGEIDGLKLSASLDGLNMLGDISWEHKSLNDGLKTALKHGTIPDEYHPQLEQGLMLSGAVKCLFMASSGDRSQMFCAYYESNTVLRQQIVSAWKQFAADMAAYVPEVANIKPTGKSPETLPALRIEVTGMVTSSNLAEYKAHAMSVFAGINRKLVTDADFADAEKTIKWAGDVEQRLAAAKQHAQSQMGSIDDLYRTIDDISAEARRVRLDLDKMVKLQKEDIKSQIVMTAKDEFARYASSVNEKCDGYLTIIVPDFAGAIKGKRTIDSLTNAVNTELANAKIATDKAGIDIREKIITFNELTDGFEFLFADLRNIISKPADDFERVIKGRISDHKLKEIARIEAERTRIATEERIKAESVARAKADAEIAAARAEEQAKARAEADKLERQRRDQVAAEVEARQQAHRLKVEAEELSRSAVVAKAERECADAIEKAQTVSTVRAELNALLDKLSDVQLQRMINFVKSRYVETETASN